MRNRIVPSALALLAILSVPGVARGESQPYTITLAGGAPGSVTVRLIENPTTPAAATRFSASIRNVTRVVIRNDVPSLVEIKSADCLIEVGSKRIATMGPDWSLDVEHGCSLTGREFPGFVMGARLAGYTVTRNASRMGTAIVKVIENPATPNAKTTLAAPLLRDLGLPIARPTRIPTLATFQDSSDGCLVEISQPLFERMGANWSLDFEHGCSVLGRP